MKNIDKTKILIYDIETSYMVGAVWNLYETNVAYVLRNPFILSVSWKWLGEKTTHVMALPDFKGYKKDKHSDKELVNFIWALFDKADAIVAHNGNGYDQKWVYGRLAVYNIKPPSPSKYIDTLLISRSKFKFPSNKLKDLGIYFGLGEKLETGGIGLWVDCVEHDREQAWKLMRRYNKQDVVLLEKIYLHILPFITNHPHVGALRGEKLACPNCGEDKLQKRGFGIRGNATKVQRFHCQGCGAWTQRSIEKVLDKEIK